MCPKSTPQTNVSMSNSKRFADSKQPRRFNSFRLNDRLPKQISDRIFNSSTDKSQLEQTSSSVVYDERAAPLKQPKLLSKSYLDISTQQGYLSHQDFILSQLANGKSYLSKPQTDTGQILLASYACTSPKPDLTHEKNASVSTTSAIKNREQPSL
jgi:hypothetical protein